MVIFHRDNADSGGPANGGGGVVKSFRKPGSKNKKLGEYSFYTEFQSHEPEFDYLKSLEIEEKINKIRWCKPSNNALFLLSTNDKTIKLWKVFDKKIKTVSMMNLDASQQANGPVPVSTLKIPKLHCQETVTTSVPRRVFSNAHAYHINSISPNSDGETYLSADDLRINLWNLGIADQSFNVVDIKPTNMEELTEVITAAEFHPSECNIFMYSSSRGSVKLGDMRQAALCDTHAKIFEEAEHPGNKSFFSEIIASVSDIKFTLDGRYIISRDYLTLKIWDINMESRPVKTIQIHEYLRSKLCDLYENDCIFDKFECAVSGDGNNFVTGSYNNYFHIYDRYGQTDICIEASKLVGKSGGGKLDLNHQADKTSNAKEKGGPPVDINPEDIDFSKKVLHLAWHPEHSAVAIAGLNNMYIYCV